MNTALSLGNAWFPLVPRPRPPGLPLRERIDALTALANGLNEGTFQQRVTRASAVFNSAALIASDCGVPALASDLCRRQFELFARQAPLPAWMVHLALQPVLNIPRQLIRNGCSDNAHALLRAIHQAATERAIVAVSGIAVDFATLTGTPDARKEAVTLTWTALLADGTRALAQSGRWQQAADNAAASHGIGTRLLDGRQAAILAALAAHHPDLASELVEQSAAAELWEHAVQAVLRVLCQRAAGLLSMPDIASMTDVACALVSETDPPTTVARVRIGLAAGHLIEDPGSGHAHELSQALTGAAVTDAYAARDLLVGPDAHIPLGIPQRLALEAVVHASGLNAGTIPVHPQGQLAATTRQAEAVLRLG